MYVKHMIRSVDLEISAQLASYELVISLEQKQRFFWSGQAAITQSPFLCGYPLHPTRPQPKIAQTELDLGGLFLNADQC